MLVMAVFWLGKLGYRRHGYTSKPPLVIESEFGEEVIVAVQLENTDVI